MSQGVVLISCNFSPPVSPLNENVSEILYTLREKHIIVKYLVENKLIDLTVNNIVSTIKCLFR